MPALEKDVRRLDVSMNDPDPMRILEPFRDVQSDGDSIGRRQLPLSSQPFAQGLTLHARHDVVQKASRCAGIDERKDVRMPECCRDLDLAPETAQSHMIDEIRVNRLDGHASIVLAVPGRVDRPHSPLTEDVLQFVSVADFPVQCLVWIEVRRYGRSAHRLFGGRGKDAGAKMGDEQRFDLGPQGLVSSARAVEPPIPLRVGAFQGSLEQGFHLLTRWLHRRDASPPEMDVPTASSISRGPRSAQPIAVPQRTKARRECC